MRNEEYLFAILGSKLPPAGKVRLFNDLSWDLQYYCLRDNPLVRDNLVRLIEILLSAEPDSRDGQLDALRLLNTFAIAGIKWMDDDSYGKVQRIRNPFDELLDPILRSEWPEPSGIRRHFASKSAETRATLLDLYFRRGWSPPEECLLPVLRDSDPGFRKRAFASVRRYWPLEVRDVMIRAVDDPDPEVARLTIRSLGACYFDERSPAPAKVGPDPVRGALIGQLFTQAELDAIPAELRAKSRWRSRDPVPIPGERRPAKVRAQAILSLGQMPCAPESVAAILRTLSDPHEEVVSAAAVAVLSPNFITDEPTWAKIADALLQAIREKATRERWTMENSFEKEVELHSNDPVKQAANLKWRDDRAVFCIEPLQTILRTLATRPELRRHARDAVPELITLRPGICAAGQYGDDTPGEGPRYKPDVASPDTRHLSQSLFPRFRFDLPHKDTLQLTAIRSGPTGSGEVRMSLSVLSWTGSAGRTRATCRRWRSCSRLWICLDPTGRIGVSPRRRRGRSCERWRWPSRGQRSTRRSRGRSTIRSSWRRRRSTHGKRRESRETQSRTSSECHAPRGR